MAEYQFNLEHSSVPIFSTVPSGSRAANAKRDFRGTGFFVGKKKPTLVTAKSVVVSAGTNLSFDYRSVEANEGGPLTIRELGSPRVHDKYDVAAFDVESPGNVRSTPLLLDQPSQLETIFSYDYGGTHAYPNSLKIEKKTWVRLGNTTGFVKINDVPHIKTSFPMFSGSRGAPIWIFQSGEFCIVGMLVQESGEWLQAPINRSGFGHSQYFLPHGVGLSVAPLAQALSELSVEFETIARHWRVRLGRWLLKNYVEAKEVK